MRRLSRSFVGNANLGVCDKTYKFCYAHHTSEGSPNALRRVFLRLYRETNLYDLVKVERRQRRSRQTRRIPVFESAEKKLEPNVLMDSP
jgi:hypothetical protein